MNLIQNVKGRLGLKKKSTTTWGELSSFFDRVRGADTSGLYGTPTQFLSAFELAGYVGNIVSIIAGDASRLDIDFYKNKKEVESEELDNFRLGDLSIEDFVYSAVQHYLLDGNVFVMKTKKTMANVVYNSYDYILLNPATVDIYTKSGLLCNSTANISGDEIAFYRVTMQNSFIVDVPANEMIHKRMPSPHNPIRGMGKIQQNLTTFEQDRISSIFNNQFFNQGAKIPYAITPEEDLSPVRFNEMSKLIHERLEGASNWMKIFIMPFKGEIKPMQVSHTDMQYLEQKQFTKKDIREAFQVPIVLLGGDDARFDSAEEQIRAYYSFTLPRYCNPIQSILTEIYSEAFKDNRLVVKIEYPKVYNVANAIAAFDRGAITPNELRKIMDFEEVEENPLLDDFYQTGAYLPLSEQIVAQSPQPLPGQQNSQAPQQVQPPQTQEAVAEEEMQTEGKSFFFDQKVTRAGQARIHRRAKRTKSRLSSIISKEIRKFYSALEAKCNANIKAYEFIDKKVPTELFDFEEEAYNAKKAAKAMFTSGIAIGINDANEIFGTNIDNSTQNPRVRLVVEKLSKRYSNLTIDTRREELRKIVETWRADNQSISELKGRIQDYFQTLTGKDGWRADRIARTEASLAWDDAAMMGYDEMNIASFDVYGCEDVESDCGKTNVPRDEVEGLEFHPNHTGTIIPSLN